MKTILISSLISFFGVISYAQNWELVNANRTVFFQRSDSTHITNTIVIDSSEMNGSNTSYYSGYAFKYCDTCANFSYEYPIIYRYAKEFIGHTITNDITNNQYNLDGNIIKQNSLLNDSWNFNASLTATTISKSEQPILGVLDSVKVIELSNSDTIIISKNHGIIRYPDFLNPGKYFELVGYHQGQNSYGAYLPNFWRTYDFNVGDVFCYESTFSDYCYYDNHRGRIKILENLSIQDTIKFKIKYLSNYYSLVNAENCYQSSSYTINKIDTISVIFNKGYENNFGIQKIDNLSNILSYPAPIMNRYVAGSVSYIHSEQYIDDLFGKSKQIHHYNSYGDSLLTEVTFISQKHFSIFFGATLMLPEPILGEIYTSTLVGTIKNGDTLGIIYDYPDDLGFEEQTIKNELSFYPNPTSNQITLKGSFKSVTIYNSIGQVVFESFNPNQIIDVSKLTKGLYVIKGIDKNDLLYTSKLIID